MKSSVADPAGERLDVQLGDRSYPIFVGAGKLDQIDLLDGFIGGQALVVSNETVAPLYLDRLVSRLGHGDLPQFPARFRVDSLHHAAPG